MCKHAWWNFTTSPKINPVSSRTIVPEQTLQRLQPLLKQLPVTRISDLTPLDPIRLPVFSVVTPLARDLTTHMGKGADPLSAEVSALMEAVERVSAEAVNPARLQQASFKDLQSSGKSPIDPLVFTLPDDSSYTPEQAFNWLAGVDLMQQVPALLPADLALNPPTEGLLHAVDTNGLASGNTYLEAVVHGLNEVIERDVQSQIEFQNLFAEAQNNYPSINLKSLPVSAQHWLKRIQQHKLVLTLHNVTNDLGVATIRALITDYEYPTPSGSVTQHFIGWGSAPNSELALLRAITEAVQSRLGILQAARDSFNTTTLGLRPYTRSQRRRLFEINEYVDFNQISNFQSDDLYEDLQFLLARLQSAGVPQVIAVDLTRPEWNIPVVRVRVPGLSQFAVNQRRVDWRCLRYVL